MNTVLIITMSMANSISNDAQVGPIPENERLLTHTAMQYLQD